MKTLVITSPIPLKDEAVICNSLFAHGLELLHLRKPGCERVVYEKFLQQIMPRYRNRIVIHDYYELVETYKLHGIHLKSGQANNYNPEWNYPVSISCHSVEEIKKLPFRPAYCFLSPVFDSISKQGYTGKFPILPDVHDFIHLVIALGGITPEKTDLCRLAGFQGVAALGYIWEKPEEALNRFIRLKTPYVMSIAGFDPSSGAGVTADLKTFEATGSYGLGICSAITFQNEDTYTGTHWIEFDEIRKQCELQFQKHQPGYLKIGLIKDFTLLEQLTAWLNQAFPALKIIWDPILKASAGYTFHETNAVLLATILKRLYLITPNTEELSQLFGSASTPDSLQKICRKSGVNILWKGGHNSGNECSDCLVTSNKISYFTVQRSLYSKHGTGCILSAAITSGLASGLELETACSKAQLYVTKAIHSNDSKLSFHYLSGASSTSVPVPSELNLQYITAPKPGLSIAGQIEAVCRGGIRWVQLRMKNTPIAEFLSEGILAKEICQRYNALFIINDNTEVARQLEADGVHLGKEDMDPREARKILGPGKIIGATCNTWEDILLRQSQEVDYIGLGPFTYTTTKEKLSPILGLKGYSKLLKQMREAQISIPVFAIGGITETDIKPLINTGIQGIALSGLIKNSDDLCTKTLEIRKLMS